ncbi:hypothetical protein AGR4A_pTi0119 [Agrobacterium tumefaciens str. B6]|uniref:Uncharacterized protein n=1 Tax=Agrobacterium tumefaciens str. B6 TaxID=1183423 RepID=A0A822VD67_AGRTU|nr:hypothetical protein AGR1C_pTi0007 [Agrobacterium fabacearum TT111]CVI25521.1 hypothetical protein AGR4A_pTi0119 [Agrobacterium tumefaciens str. B6]
MSIALPYTLYSHLHASTLRTPRWDEDGVRHYFYKSADAAREAVHQLLSEVAKDPEICGNEFNLLELRSAHCRRMLCLCC